MHKLQKTTYYFWMFILIHTLIWTLGPALFRPTIPHDTLEGITWGLQWQFGYNKHPFLSAWLCAGITELFGVSGWPVYLLAQLAVSITFIAVWRLAQHILPLTQALIATLVLEGIFFYNINSFNFTPDTLQSPLWALLVLFFYNALVTQKIRDWLICALLTALCICTKYQVVLLLLPMFLFCLFNSEARQSFTRPGIYWALGLFLLLITPHLVWLYQHHFITLTYATEISSDYTQDKNAWGHIIHPLGFLVNTIFQCSGICVLLWPFYSKGTSTILVKSFQKQFLIALGLGPVVLTLLLCTLNGNYFPPRWSTPYFFMLGILVIVCLKPRLSKKQLTQFAVTLMLFSSLVFVTRMSTFTLYPRVDSDAFLPNKQMALSLSKLWQNYSQSPLSFLAGSHYLVSGVVPYLSEHPKPFFSWDLEESSWIDENELVQKGGLFIWDKQGYYTWDKQSQMHTTIPNEVVQHFPQLQILQDFIFYRLSDGRPIIIGVAILPPKIDNHHVKKNRSE